MTTDELDLSYLAGLFDGEGCLGLWSKGKGCTKVFGMQVNMTDEASVRLFHDRFGGSFRVKLGTPINHKKQWLWRVTHNKALETYKVLSPYLKLKKVDYL